MSAQCRVVTVNGEPIRVLGARGPLTDEDQAALGEIVRAAKAKLASMPPGPIEFDCPTCSAPAGALCRREPDTGVGRSPHAERRALVEGDAR